VPYYSGKLDVIGVFFARAFANQLLALASGYFFDFDAGSVLLILSKMNKMNAVYM
jgi:hypothetical protein